MGGSIGGGQFAPDECVSFGGACTNPPDGGAIAIECNQISDCRARGNPGATACCLQGSTSCYSNYTCPGGPAGACAFPKYRGGRQVACEGTGGGAATACASGELQVCQADVDCPGGTHCVAGKWKWYEVGFCE
jgi:hypothetical protein